MMTLSKIMKTNVQRLNKVTDNLAKGYREERYFRFNDITHSDGLRQLVLCHNNGNCISIFTDYKRNRVRVWKNAKLIGSYDDRGFSMCEY